MTNYENDIINLLPGETPKQKYDNLKELLLSKESAKQFQDELIRDRETFMTIMAHGVENEKIERLIKSKIIMIDNLLKK